MDGHTIDGHNHQDVYTSYDRNPHFSESVVNECKLFTQCPLGRMKHNAPACHSQAQDMVSYPSESRLPSFFLAVWLWYVAVRPIPHTSGLRSRGFDGGSIVPFHTRNKLLGYYSLDIILDEVRL